MTTFPSPTNVTSFNEIMRYGNMVASNSLGLMILVITFVVSFMAMRQGQAEIPGVNAKIFVASSFITMIMSVFLFIIGMVNDTIMYFCIVMVAIGTFASLVAGGRPN